MQAELREHNVEVTSEVFVTLVTLQSKLWSYSLYGGLWELQARLSCKVMF